VVIGQLLPTKFAGVAIGDELAFGRQLHRVVGVFAAAGQIFEGEVWAELDDLMSENNVSEVSVLVARVAEPRRLNEVAKSLEDARTVSVDAKAEPKYYENVARSAVGFRFLGNLIGTIMGLGAVFAGANTMYAAMSKRVREMGTLRALGFGAWSVGAALMVESTLVGILGGALGIAASFAFDGYGMDLFELSFRLDVTRSAVLGGACLALASGILGGLLPARAAARLEIVDALRHV
jgi:putative ABC transport system permease protein